jgi:hypothetical protein
MKSQPRAIKTVFSLNKLSLFDILLGCRFPAANERI